MVRVIGAAGSAVPGTYDGFRGWVATIARHRALDHLRRVTRRPPALALPAEDLLGLDAATAGHVLGKRAGAVRTAAHRGLKTLHTRLDDDPDVTGDRRTRGIPSR